MWSPPIKRNKTITDQHANDAKDKKGNALIGNKRSKSPFKFMNKISREQSPNLNGAANLNSKQIAKNAKEDKKNNDKKTKVSRSSEFGMKFDPLVNQFQTLGQQAQLEAQYGGKSAFSEQLLQKSPEPEIFNDTDSNYPFAETDDLELQAIMEHVDEYYYGVRLFPGQDTSKVYVGWTTSKFHLISEKLDKPFGTDLISQCTLINTTSDGSITSSLVRKDCYCLSAAELNQTIVNSDPEASKGSGSANGILLG